MPSYPTVRLDFWFDLSCPYAYLASQRLAAALHGRSVDLRYRPMLLGGVFRDIGAGEGPMATLSEAKRGNLARDLARWAELAGVPLHTPAEHPRRTVLALRTLLGLPEPLWPAAVHELFAAYWRRGDDIATADAIDAALLRAGVPAELRASAAAGADSAARKQDLRARTEEAVRLGIFGAPAFVVHVPPEQGGPHLLWGQDRLTWVTAMLDGWRPPAPPPPPAPPAAPSHAHTVDFYFDVASPFAYLGLTQLARVTAGHHVRLRPILLGGLFRAIGTPDVPLATFPEPKRRYVARELELWAAWWGQPFVFPRRFPQRTTTAQRLLVLVRDRHELALALALELGRVMWAKDGSLEDEATLVAALARVGAPAELYAAAHQPAAKEALLAATAQAAQAGVFGVPTYVLDDGGPAASYWGQDRLELVARALAAPRGR